MTKKDLLNALKGIPMDTEIIVIDATDFEDTEHEINGVCTYPLDVAPNKRDEVNIIINEGVRTK